MNTLGCLDRPTDGSYLLDGEEVVEMSGDERARLRNRKIGFVFQNFNLLSRTTAMENVELPLLYSGRFRASQRRERARQLLKKVGLESRVDHHPSQLSGGQQQRVAIARAMANEPPILLADEPTGNIDSHTSREVMDLFRQLNQEDGITIILVTHDQEVARHAAADRRLARRAGDLRHDRFRAGHRSPASARRRATMKRFFFWMIVVGIVVGASAAGYSKFHGAKQDAASLYRTMKVRRGEIRCVVNSSGTVQPVLSVQVGAFVSGPIKEVKVDFNDKVKKDQVLALVDELIPTAQRDQAKASLECASANLLQAEAKLKQAKRDWERAKMLLPKQAISDTDYDLAEATYETAKANVEVCKATIEQNKGALKLAQSNLDYTIIESPVDGVITDRKVDPGQTVATQFQTPVLFVVAPDLEKRVYVQASVDEADIGMIREAQLRSEPVTFTVDAYPKDTFHGKIAQVRLTPTTVQNVVTYTVIVEAPNLELKLLPGMTANLTFQIEKHEGKLKVPNAALRFFPKPNQVRPCDMPILDGVSPDNKEAREAEAADDAKDDPAAKERIRKQRYVWVDRRRVC